MHRSTQSIRMLLGTAFVLLFAVIAFLSYSLLDASVSLNYSREGNQSTVAAYKKLSNVVLSEWQNLSEEEVLKKLTTIQEKFGAQEENLIKREKNEGLIWYDGVRFEFKEGKLVAVR